MSPEQKTELTNSLLMMNDGWGPLFDAAEGMRAEAERRGFSPTMAEQVAGEFLVCAVRLAMTGAKP